jgi:hypothetical protein
MLPVSSTNTLAIVIQYLCSSSSPQVSDVSIGNVELDLKPKSHIGCGDHRMTAAHNND